LLVVAAMSAAYAGEGKTDAKDAYVIAETARLRRDLAVIDTDTSVIPPTAHGPPGQPWPAPNPRGTTRHTVGSTIDTGLHACPATMMDAA
jgi:hypothetical protein